MLALKPNFNLNPTHSMLPEPLDPDTPGWESFFVAQKEPNISSHTTPTLAIGFILICEANLLATDAVRELYPQFRDRSEDWKEVGTRNDLNSKIAEFEGRLATLRERMAGFEVQGRGEDSVKVLQLSVGDLFAEVGLLIREFSVSSRSLRRLFADLFSSRFRRSSSAPSSRTQGDLGPSALPSRTLASTRRGGPRQHSIPSTRPDLDLPRSIGLHHLLDVTPSPPRSHPNQHSRRTCS